MSDTLSIHLNRARLHSIEVPESFATPDSFVVELDNHGEATHVHLRLDAGLSEIASLPASNHYVRAGAVTRIPVSVHEEGPVGGTLTVATAYGSETEDIDITVEPTAGKQRVEIDESLIERSGGSVESARTTPANRTNRTPRPGAGTATATGVDTPTLLAGAALVILVGIALLFVEGIALFVGALAILVGFFVAGYLLLY